MALHRLLRESTGVIFDMNGIRSSAVASAFAPQGCVGADMIVESLHCLMCED